MRRIGMAAFAALAAAFLPASQAFAWMDWCDSEPPLTVVTPGGHHVTVNNFLSAPRADRHLLEKAWVYGYAESEQPGESEVHVYVVLPRGGSEFVRVNSKSVHYSAETSANGRWGTVIELDLSVPVD